MASYTVCKGWDGSSWEKTRFRSSSIEVLAFEFYRRLDEKSNITFYLPEEKVIDLKNIAVLSCSVGLPGQFGASENYGLVPIHYITFGKDGAGRYYFTLQNDQIEAGVQHTVAQGLYAFITVLVDSRGVLPAT